MLASLGTVLHRRRRLALLLLTLAALLAGAVGATVNSALTNGRADYYDPGGQNLVARDIIQDATGVDSLRGYTLLVHTSTPLEVGDPRPEAVRAAERLLRTRDEVKDVVDYADPKGEGLIARDGGSTVVLAHVGPMDEKDTLTAERDLQKAIEADPALRDRTLLGGATPGQVQVGKVTNEDLALAEGIATPVILLLLFLVFRGVVAACVPVVGALVSLLLTLAGLRAATEATQVSTGALNLAFALSLGLSIDFGLLLVSRYREEIAASGPGVTALRRTLATAGRTVLFSALTVAAALAALMVFPHPYLRSMGLAGVITVAASALFALVGLPAILAALGARINALAPKRWQRSTAHRDAAGRRWSAVASAVMRRPAVVAVGAAAVLLLIAAPVAGIRFTGVDPATLPKDVSAGKVAHELERDYAEPTTSPLQIVLDTHDGAGLRAYAERVAAVDGVSSVGEPTRLDAGHWEIDAVLRGSPLDDAAKDAATGVRALDAPHEARYTGVTADFLEQRDSIADRLPLALTVLVVVTLLLLFAFTGSLVLPVKALVMNALSTLAAFGFLVWVFQDGNLGFAPQNGIEVTTPVVVFALAFGLSTDYNVFLLGRIKEARAATGDDRAAVREGLARTGAVVTSAAVLFGVALGALVLSRLALIQELGLGATFAVLIDATLVRALLVPSLMALLGTANWWLPAPLRRLRHALRLDRLDRPGDPDGPDRPDGGAPARETEPPVTGSRPRADEPGHPEVSVR
ncbi:MMPL family transporter [Streptomyces albiaxialis]